MATRISLQYLAGLIDGEGCITIFHDRTQEGKGRIISSRLQLGMTYFPLIKRLKKQFGGFLYLKQRTGNKRDVMYWICNEQAAATVLRKCLPYMQVKPRQAKLLIKLAETRSRSNAGVRGCSAMLEQQRWNIMLANKKLNERGKDASNM